MPNRFLQGFLHNRFLFVIKIQQLHNYFAVRIRMKMISHLNQFFLQSRIVFHDTVMNDRNRSFFIHMRMGIHIAGNAMRCPAGMSDSAGLRQFFFQQLLKL